MFFHRRSFLNVDHVQRKVTPPMSSAHLPNLCLFLIPLSGLSLLFVSDDLLALHVAAHITFFVALAAHLGLVFKHQLINRDRLLERMT